LDILLQIFLVVVVAVADVVAAAAVADVVGLFSFPLWLHGWC